MQVASFSEALAAKQARMTELKADENVIGIGVGLLDPSDESKGAALIMYVRRDLPTAALDAIPKTVATTVEGTTVSVPVRVEQSGEFFSNVFVKQVPDAVAAWLLDLRSADPEYTRRVRPVPAGYSIGTPRWSGTAGLIVINYPAANQLYVLSNNHVLNNDNTTSYTETLQPGGADGGQSGTDRIGRLDRFVQLQKDSDNYLDAATAIPLDNGLLDPRYGKRRWVLPGHYVQYRVGWKMVKAGRTTGDVGEDHDVIVDSVHTDVSVNYGSYGGLGVVAFKDQSIIKSSEPVSLGGDSGSVFLRKDDRYACAVNFAGPASGQYGVAFPVNWFMSAFECRVAAPGLRATDEIRATVDDPAAFSSEVPDRISKPENADFR